MVARKIDDDADDEDRKQPARNEPAAAAGEKGDERSDDTSPAEGGKGTKAAVAEGVPAVASRGMFVSMVQIEAALGNVI